MRLKSDQMEGQEDEEGEVEPEEIEEDPRIERDIPDQLPRLLLRRQYQAPGAPWMS